MMKMLLPTRLLLRETLVRSCCRRPPPPPPPRQTRQRQARHLLHTSDLARANDGAENTKSSSPALSPSSPLLYFHPGFRDGDAEKMRWAEAFSSSFSVTEDFVSEAEEAAVLREVEPHLARMRYERDHWDEAIVGFRETEKKHWTKASSDVVDRIRAASFRSDHKVLSHAHVLDLAADGHINPHVDSVRFCGDVVAVLSLMSAAVARFRLAEDKSLAVDVLLRPRSLYVTAGASRFDFTHEILADGESVFAGAPVPRARRVSVVCRCEPRPEDTK